MVGQRIAQVRPLRSAHIQKAPLSEGGVRMGQYATKGTNDDGDEIWLASDGREYKTRAGAWKRSKGLEEKEAIESESNGMVAEESSVTGCAPGGVPAAPAVFSTAPAATSVAVSG